MHSHYYSKKKKKKKKKVFCWDLSKQINKTDQIVFVFFKLTYKKNL